jgi:hypothetical protein
MGFSGGKKGFDDLFFIFFDLFSPSVQKQL